MKVFKCLESERLAIRRFKEKDKEDFLTLMQNELVTRNLAFTPEQKSYKGAARTFKMILNRYNSDEPLLQFALVQKLNDQFIGICGMSYLEPFKMEVFYALLPEFWKKGYAAEILGRIKTHLKELKTCKEIHAFINQQNEISRKVAVKNGFENTGLVNKENFPELVYDFCLVL